jgi:hypothetical protein
VGDFKFGFAQFDVDGKSGLIDRNGSIVVEPKYGFIEAIGRDRFGVSDERRLGGLQGGDEFSGSRWRFTASGGISRQLPQSSAAEGVIDISGQSIEPQVASREFDKDDPARRWVQKDKLWGLQRADRTCLVEPKFADWAPLTPVRFEAMTSAGQHARNAKIGGKWGRIALDGRWLIEPNFDYVSPEPDLFVAAIDGKRGFMHSDGTWLIEPRFEAARLRDAERRHSLRRRAQRASCG